MEVKYTPEQRIVITSIANFSVQLSLFHNDYYKTEEFKKILLNNENIDGNFIFGALNNCGFFNEGSLPTILYTLLVYPKGAVKKINSQAYNEELSRIVLDLSRENNKYGLRIQENTYKNPKDILTHMRNAVSHARVEFKDDNFVFTDLNPSNDSEKIIFEISKEVVGILIQDLYNALILIVKELQAEQLKAQ